MTTPTPEPGPGQYRLAKVMVALTILLITFGAMVTSTGSGMAFTDWPRSDGGWMPERALSTLPGFLEHFHRLIGASVGLVMLILTIWIGMRERQRHGLRRLAVLGLVLVVVQGLFGGIGVRLGTPAWTSVTHGVLAQLTLATFAVLTFALSPQWRTVAGIAAPARTGRRITVAATAIVVLQTLLGAIARHSGNLVALWTHVGHALVVFFVLVIAAGVAAGKLPQVPGMRRQSRLLLTLLVLQVTLGFVALLVRMGKQPENIDHLWSCALISAHVLVGALLTLTSAQLAVTVFRSTQPA